MGPAKFSRAYFFAATLKQASFERFLLMTGRNPNLEVPVTDNGSA
jgi:hypothetical protein